MFLPMVLCYGTLALYFVDFVDFQDPVYIWGVQAGNTTSFVGTFWNDVVQSPGFFVGRMMEDDIFLSLQGGLLTIQA